MTHPTSCPACDLYRHSREPVIRGEIARTTPEPRREARWEAFMAGVHDRHLVAAGNLAVRRGLGRFAALVALTTEETR